MNLYEQAREGLRIARAQGLVRVDDGQTQWVCEAVEWDEMRAQLERLPRLTGEDASALAYAELCDSVGGTVISDSGANRQVVDETTRELARRAVAAELIRPDGWVVREYLARGAKRLRADTWAMGVHGITGQDVEEGELAAGTLVRNVTYQHTQEGRQAVRFEASSDGGVSWYPQRSYGTLALE